MTPTRLSATPWKRRTQLPLGFLGRSFQPRRRAPSGARTSKSSRVEAVTARETSASRSKSGVNSRRMGWRKAGPASHPATADRSGGRSSKIRAMRIRRRRMGAIPRYENWVIGVRAILQKCGEVASEERRVPEWELLVYTPAVFVRVANKGVAAYGTWKSVRRMGGGIMPEGIGIRLEEGSEIRRECEAIYTGQTSIR